ncbi:MAG: hypothetical protein J2P32_07050 [Actinobacteria bacterium]|nr:hypothetical protein [Actinomycetota bacterium]
MRIHFEITAPGGAVIAAGSRATHTAEASSWSNLGEVKRLLRAAGVTPGLGQRLAIWVERDVGRAVFPDETIDRAARAFHDALGTHLDDPAAAHSPARDWIDAPATAVAEALLHGGWVPPVEHDDPDPVPDDGWPDILDLDLAPQAAAVPTPRVAS